MQPVDSVHLDRLNTVSVPSAELILTNKIFYKMLHRYNNNINIDYAHA